ncbi:hypothetical protein OPV22_020996 [Ensete ventricosum]|uniref:Uncharacterized protein n=1 Tax=Ensete ventricosum TaxID=4639 RepID=A0AAV8QL17_ENSVE|nr:hypothetical protein OPV22_020996 [Ensete ventricosum]
MAGGLVGGSGGLNPTVVRFVLVVMALGLAGYIVGPPLYWHLAEALGRSSACPLCAPCDCSAQPLLSLPQELINVSSTDCAKRDPEVGEEMDKNFTDLLAEELKLREEETTEAQHRADVKLLEAKKLASQYQKEADKCNSGMDTSSLQLFNPQPPTRRYRLVSSTGSNTLSSCCLMLQPELLAAGDARLELH